MKLFKLMKDGGKESRVWGFFLAEIKSLFSVVLLHFADGSREAYHSHAFNSVSWVLRGRLEENMFDGRVNVYAPSLKPVVTRRTDFHKVVSTGDTYVLSFRGPWVNRWFEYLPDTGEILQLANGRRITRVMGSEGFTCR
jgi:hypothetical protein